MRKSPYPHYLITRAEIGTKLIAMDGTAFMSELMGRQFTNVDETLPESEWNPAVGALIPEDRTLVKVSPNAKLEEATTLMQAYNYSQLPVMGGEKKVNGVISWKSIGSSVMAQTGTSEVRHYMDKEISRQIVDATDSLIQVSHIIEDHDYVLVKSQQDAIIGIVTASDMTGEFRNSYEPLYLSGTMELNLRQVVKNANFEDCDFDKAKMNPVAIEKLTLGEYYRLIGPKKNWRKLNLDNVDQGKFRECLCKAIQIRNSVMHFSVRKLSGENMDFLRSFSKFLKGNPGARVQ